MPEFPATGLLDTFKRAETPLGREEPYEALWTKLPWALAKGHLFSETYGWTPNEPGVEGAYWTPESYAEPSVSVGTHPEPIVAYFGLWACMDPTKHDGYFLKATSNASNYTFVYELKKYVGGVPTTLESASGVDFKSEGFAVGLSVSAGKVTAWKVKTGASVVVFEKADATYTTGRVGIEGEGAGLLGEVNFKAGAGSGGGEKVQKLTASLSFAATLPGFGPPLGHKNVTKMIIVG